jgi:hypothetical protein
MDFEKALKEITEFLNISKDTLLSQPIDLLSKMIDAVNDDDMFKVHSLGYSINSTS